MERRDFLKCSLSAGAVGLAGLSHPAAAFAQPQEDRALDALPKPGPKPVVRGKRAVCSSSHPLVTDTMEQVMRDGGNAVDAGVAGAIAQAVVEPHMTNHTGTVSMLYWEKKTSKAYHLNSSGTIVPEMPPFRPMPYSLFPGDEGPGPCAAIPGFFPGIKVMHERFGSKPWGYLCEPAIAAAEEGHTVHSFEYRVLAEELEFYTFFPSGRKMFTPDGFIPAVGERWRNPALAEALRRCAKEGPDYFIRGEWAKHFVEAANSLGWNIKLEHMTAIPPRWQEPLRFEHRDNEVLALSPPEITGVASAMFLGILRNLDVRSLGHYTESAKTLFYMAYALRRIYGELENFNDPEVFGVPVEDWLSPDHIARLARIIERCMPKIDMTKHVQMTTSPTAMAAMGLPAPEKKEQAKSGSCELSIVDAEGNWVQMMNTLQSGGIPGMVVDGVPMFGSSALPGRMGTLMNCWLTGGGRVTLVIGNTIVLRNGVPWLSMGTPGIPCFAVPQVLANVLEFGMDPYEATIAPRMLPMGDTYEINVENRIPEKVVAYLAKLGATIVPGREFNYHMGSFQVCWRDAATGLMNACADHRRAGKAGGF
jgi:gamma-glutamyltranspeptidase/glutathione hydrolase